MRIGAHQLQGVVLAAPMAGISDRPFRRIARRYGAALAVSEMIASRPELRDSRKSRLRRDHAGEQGPISVQIAGADPAMLAQAAAYNVAHGADIVDINMGCPAKKVCNAYAGSALLSDERLVGRILDAVVRAAPVPVTLKIRTGPSPDCRNAVRIARMAESAGIQMLAVHGRTRACGFSGEAEYATIGEVKAAVRIPVVANGDIRTPEAARAVLDATGADAVMIGRGAQGRPWFFREVATFLETGRRAAPATLAEIRDTLVDLVAGLHAHYGGEAGARIARKHVGWTVQSLGGGPAFRARFNAIVDPDAQMHALCEYFAQLAAAGARQADGTPWERLAA